MNDRPYRLNVGAVVFNKYGRVLVARRADVPSAFEGAPGGWQLPQGGIDPGEDPRRAVIRELKEEIGTDRVEILAEYPHWLQYRFSTGPAGRHGASIPGAAAALVCLAVSGSGQGHPVGS